MTDLNDKTLRKEMIRRYLNAETTIEEEQLLMDYFTHTKDRLTPEEEDVRLLLTATKDDSLHQPLSQQKEEEFDRLMHWKSASMPLTCLWWLASPFCQQHKKSRNRRQWRYPVIGAAAACLLLMLTLYHHKTEPMEQTVVAQKLVKKLETQPLPSSEENRKPTIPKSPVTTEMQLKPQDKKKHVRHRKTTAQKPPIPDTLGNGIWKSEENVLSALQMLADCEATIQREEQEVRNEILKATFHATPQPAGARLVSNEAGDYEVIDPKTIIDL